MANDWANGEQWGGWTGEIEVMGGGYWANGEQLGLTWEDRWYQGCTGEDR